MARPIPRREALRLAASATAATVAAATLAPRQASAADRDHAPAELQRRFIYDQAPFPECHASTIVETRQGLLASWFGGTAEGRDDVDIYTARFQDGTWSAPERVADGRQDDGSTRHPCWNPVLFQPRQGPLLLFYKVGPRPHNWWGMLKTSDDDGRTWSAARRLPDGIMGPVRAKPIELEDGTLLCGSSTEHAGWQVQMETTRNPLGDWSRSQPLNRPEEWGAIQPTVLPHGNGRIQILCRSRQRVILEAWSTDNGRSWSPLTATPLPNPSSGIDAVRLKDGRFALIYNHLPQGRDLLNLAISNDGLHWSAALVLEQEPGEFSYPAIIQTRDGHLHMTYTWKRRRVRHVVVDPSRLPSRPITKGRWPS
jgi:predicted neuraminidase